MAVDKDLVVVGGGILGLAVASELLGRRPGLRVAVLERETEVGRHQTGSNSGVVHGGIYYKPGSLKAKLCVDGMARLYAFCDEHGIRYERCGKVIVATEAAELGRLEELEARGRANGVPGLRRIGPEELRELEPHAQGIAALHSPSTGIIDFADVARALAARLREAGAEVTTGCEVHRLERRNGGVTVTHAHGQTRASNAIVCAGAWTDRLAVDAGAPADPRIVPFRGAYLRLRADRRGLVRGLIYPVPNPELPFLGVHLTKRIDGEVLLGPTALLVGARDAYKLWRVRLVDLRDTVAWPGTWRMVAKFHRTALQELHMASSRKAFAAACARYVPELRARGRDRRPRRSPGAGARPRRRARRRLRHQRARFDDVRPQRAVAGRDLLAGDRIVAGRPARVVVRLAASRGAAPPALRTMLTRERAIAALTGERFDIVVIGGGITGAGVALDAASRGYSVALVEKADFASGTSSRSSKLVHGGLRYLQNFDLGLVREALLERRLLVKLAPHLVRPLKMVVPAFDGAHPDRMVGIGLNMYDVMATERLRARRSARRQAQRAQRPGEDEPDGDWSPERHRVISGEEVGELLPALAARRSDRRLSVLRLPDRRREAGADRPR